MGIKQQVKALDLLKKIVSGNLDKIAYVDYRPQKETFAKKKNTKPLKRTTPEEQGISSEYLLSFLKELDKAKEIHTQGIMIVRNGAVILEGAYAPYDLDTWRTTHSLCKSLVGIAIGIAIEEGYFKLQDTIYSILNEKDSTNKEGYLKKLFRQKEITIENLLTMSSGVTFNEVGVLIDDKWTESFMESQTVFQPGDQFAYNSMNTYMLSALIQCTTGQNVMEFLEERLFKPLGIENVSWELSPENIVKGGWGLYITLEDRTKLGQLFLNKGKWEGKQIVPAKWLEQMTKKRMDTPDHMNSYGYGYQVWIGKRKGSFLFNGVLGQNTIIYPDLNMVISVMSSNQKLFVNSTLMDIVDRYFASPDFKPEDALAPNYTKLAELNNYRAGLSFQKEFPVYSGQKETKRGWQRKSGCKKSRFPMLIQDIPEGLEEIPDTLFEALENRTSVMPVFIQGLQNHFSKGITRFRFVKEKGTLILKIEEHEAFFNIPIGFTKPKHSVMEFQGEFYQIAARGILKKTEEDVPVLKLQIAFLETTNCRNMTFYFNKESVLVKTKEIPDLVAVMDKVIPFIQFPLPASGMETIKNSDLVQNKMSGIFAPEFLAHPRGKK